MGIIFCRPCFTHAYIYLALSRVQDAKRVKDLIVESTENLNFSAIVAYRLSLIFRYLRRVTCYLYCMHIYLTVSEHDSGCQFVRLCVFVCTHMYTFPLDCGIIVQPLYINTLCIVNDGSTFTIDRRIVYLKQISHRTIN